MDYLKKTLPRNEITSMLYGSSVVILGINVLAGWIEPSNNTANFLGYLSIVYFTYDTLYEVFLMKRWLYVPHHTIGLVFGFRLLSDIPSNLIRPIFEFATAAEASGLIVNKRELDKQHNNLSRFLDCVYYAAYTGLRCGVMPYIISVHSHEMDNMVIGGCVGIIGMSLYWGVKWGMGLLRRKKKD